VPSSVSGRVVVGQLVLQKSGDLFRSGKVWASKGKNRIGRTGWAVDRIPILKNGGTGPGNGEVQGQMPKVEFRIE